MGDWRPCGTLPAGADEPPPITSAHRDGMMLVLGPACALPNRCIKCNAQAAGPPMCKRIGTFSPWYPLFSSAGWNAHCVDDRPIHIHFNLCPRHRAQRLATTSLVAVAGLPNALCLAACGATHSGSAVADLFTLALPALILSIMLALRPIIRPRRVHHGQAWFAGAGPEFLNSLPALPPYSA